MLNSASQSAYALLFAWMLAEQVGLPIPAVPMLLAAGAMAANGRMHFGLALLVGLVGSMIADAAWYEAGRYRGLSLVHSICRLSLEKDSCARKTQQLYHKNYLGQLRPPPGKAIKFAKYGWPVGNEHQKESASDRAKRRRAA
jgi:membrane protein DedA with SNARE-associated domain